MPTINTVNVNGSQGTVGSYTITVTAGAGGISIGDVGILLSYQSAHSFSTPLVFSVVDSLGNTWSTGSSGGINLGADVIFTNFGANEQSVSICTAKMATAVAPAATFTITATVHPSNPSFYSTITEVDFISVSGILFDTAISPASAAWLKGRPDNIIGHQTMFHSDPTFPTTNAFYLAFALPFSTLSSYPSGYTQISALNGHILGAFFNNTLNAAATDIWTQGSLTDWAAIQIGYFQSGAPTPPTPSLGGNLKSSVGGTLILQNPTSQRFVAQKICTGNIFDYEWQADSSNLVTIGTSPVTISLPGIANIDTASIKNTGGQALNVTLNNTSGNSTQFTLEPQSFIYFVGLLNFSTINLSTSSGTTNLEYIIAGS